MTEPSQISTKTNFSVNIDGTAKFSVTMSVRMAFSHIHMQCAYNCAKKCIEIEGFYDADNDKKDIITKQLDYSRYFEDQAYASGAIVSSVAYLEAIINEFYYDCKFNSPHIQRIDEHNIKSLNDYWRPDYNGQFDFFKRPKGYKYTNFPPMFSKYLTAYNIITKQEIPSDEISHRNDIINLINIRDALVHYKSEGQTVGEISQISDPYKLNHLIGKFNENVYIANMGHPFFPSRCLGAGCAKWAIETSIQFTDFFFEKINIKKIFPTNELLKSL